jgi:hypothetical protein
MWSFVWAPPGDKPGQDMRATTTAETGPQSAKEAECVAMFAEGCRRLKHSLFILWCRNQRDTLIKEMVRNSPFFREARTDTPEFIQWMDLMRAKNLPQMIEQQADLIRREVLQVGWWTAAAAWFRPSEAAWRTRA